MANQITLHFISKEAFPKTYPTLYYGETGEWFAVMGEDKMVCALTLRRFPNFHKLLNRYKKHILIEKKISLSEKIEGLLAGTPFQQAVWQALLAVPSGTTISYKELANRLGLPKAVRAVGNAVGANPISPLIPCHRIVGSKGYKGGYYWGIAEKIRLLQEEGVDITCLK